MNHISMDLVRVTEAAAIAASKWVGSGDKLSADKAATDAIRDRLNRMNFAGKIVIGEGEKDESYGLYNGEFVGKSLNVTEKLHGVDCGHVDIPEVYEIAVDPIEGTTPTVTSGPEALSVIALAEEGAMYHTSDFYMLKLAYGPKIADRVKLNITDPIGYTAKLAASALGKDLSNLMVCILNRPRHDSIVADLRKLGVRIKLIQDCDVSAAIATCRPESEIDLFYGVGGAPEAVITAAAIKCLRGGFQAQSSKKEYDPKSSMDVLTENDLIKGDCVFAATGITRGSFLSGVEWQRNIPTTHSVFMRSKSGTIRWLTVEHGN